MEWIEWTVWDRKKDNFILVKASSQRQAIVLSLERGFEPFRSTDVRPRTGDAVLMTKEEFKKFMDY